jgi:nitrogen-specific signal transduction histidine kinase
MATEPTVTSEATRQELRKLAHDISNPVGILRMAVYYLETARPDAEKCNQYYTLMNQNIDRIEGLINQLRGIAGSPSLQGPPPEIIG